MPLTVVRAASAGALWDACSERFLAGATASAPEASRRAWMWLDQRSLRDLLYERARVRGHPGWLDPPVTLFQDLSAQFGVRGRSVGLLTRRRILSRHSARLGRKILGRKPGRGHGVIGAHMLDALFSDLLPEGVRPEVLERALERLGGDDFAHRRNAWVVACYGAYLASLREHDLIDPRTLSARIARRIEAGALPEAVGGARELHVYGVVSPHARRRLLRALAAQPDVDARLYLPLEPEPDEFFDALATRREVLGDDRNASTPQVQPVPDAGREVAWVARTVKRLLAEGGTEPHRIAVVARSGRDDTGRVHRALRAAGVPATARIRTPLVEIPALKALLAILRGAARDWDHASLRELLEHPYFRTGVDVRAVDLIASRRRVSGLDEWGRALEQLLPQVSEHPRRYRARGVFEDRLTKDAVRFRALRRRLAPLSDSRSEPEWIEVTLELLREEGGAFLLRRRVCDPADERWDIVRADQRGILQLESLLREWRAVLEEEDESTLGNDDGSRTPAEWHSLLRKLLLANEIVLSTPAQKGVQVLEAQDAALVPFDHVFVVHANDGEFPRAQGSIGVLTDSERRALHAGGLPLSHRDERLRRERGLWRAVVGQDGPARVSYRTTDAAGTPLLPSLLVPPHDDAAELPRVRRPAPDVEPVTAAEADERAAHEVHAALGGSWSSRPFERRRVLVTPARPKRLAHAVAAAAAEVHRSPGLDRYPGHADASGWHPALLPNPWNGRLRDPGVLKWLEAKFDDDYAWSPSQLESYARAPFQFLVQRALRLESVEEAEEDTTALTFGAVAHQILELFYGEVMDDLPPSLAPTVEERLREIARKVCAERETRAASADHDEWLGAPLLWEQAREEIIESVVSYVRWELDHMRMKGERPVRVEYGFGFDEEPPRLEGVDVRGRPAQLLLRGRIDRVDRQGSSPKHYVLDYKKSYTPKYTAFADATALQGVLYSQVLVDRGWAVHSSRYRGIQKPGKPQNGGQILFGKPEYEKALSLALSIPSRVRRGLFEAVASAKGGWNDWDIPPEVRRNGARFAAKEHRFDSAMESAAEFAAERADG